MTNGTGVGTNTGGAAVRDLDVVALFALVGDHTRLTLLRFVVEGEHCVTECARHLGLRHSAASKQLTALAQAGLLRSRRCGRRTYYNVSDAQVLRRLLDACQALLAPGPQQPNT